MTNIMDDDNFVGMRLCEIYRLISNSARSMNEKHINTTAAWNPKYGPVSVTIILETTDDGDNKIGYDIKWNVEFEQKDIGE